jgi:hypothetical protein
MRVIKTLGLSAITAIAAMAFLGASSASAAVLCKETPTGEPAVCPEAATYGAGTIIEGTAVNPELTSDLADVICKHSETEAEITSTGNAEETVTGTIWSLNFTECRTTDIVPTACTVTVRNLPYHAEVDWVEGTHDGRLTVVDHGSGNPGALVECVGDLIDCTFEKGLFDLPLEGGNPAHITANQVQLESQGAVCPEEAFWDATYEATGENTEVWVAKEEEEVA